jgi:muramoyltetrapeptide carboxypeptidase LdcA involved in peptidoglycan recycling
VLGTAAGTPVMQSASTLHQHTYIDFEVQVDAPLDLTSPTRWWRLDGRDDALVVRGRLIGGCLNTVAWLAGTRYGDVPGWRRRCGEDGVIMHLENVELGPGALVRALTALRRHGWLDGLSGLLMGRSTGPDTADARRLSYADALHAVLDDAPFPVLCDVDIGHRPPQFTVLNGALAEVAFAAGSGTLTQWIDPATPVA